MNRFAFIWFDLHGRIGRRTWLAFTLLIGVLGYLTELLIRQAFHWPVPLRAGDSQLLPGYLGDEVSLLASLIFLWPSLAIDIKRWHDLGRSGWLVLTVYLPALALFGFELAGAGGTTAHPDPRIAVFLYMFGLLLIVYFIILAARKGMPGVNRFGQAPH